MSKTDVTLVMGKPVGSAEALRKGSVAVKLQELNLEQYEQELIDGQGYDSLELLNEMSPNELTQVADDCKMKPGHKKKFLAAFGKKDAAEESVVQPADPEVDPSMIALKEQNAEMMKQMEALKKQQSADRLKKELEEREQKIKEEAERQREADRKEAELRQKMADMQMEQMKTQMQANMNLNLATQNQAAAAAPIIINNVTGGGGGGMSEEEKKKAEEEKKKAEEELAKLEAEKAEAAKAVFERTDMDPKLLAVKMMFKKLDQSDWNMLTSSALLGQLAPYRQFLPEARSIYCHLESYYNVIRPAFGKMADGTSNSGTPKNPIDKKSHPDFAMKKEFIQQQPKDCALFVWNEPVRMDLMRKHPYFKQQPDYAGLMHVTEKVLQLGKLNKAGKAAAAVQLIAAADAAKKRMKNREELVIAELEGKMKKWMAQVRKMQAEEAAQQGGGCCVVL